MEMTLRVGEKAALHRNVFTSCWYVTYAGMPAEDRCSLVLTWTAGYHATSYNLFLSGGVREVPVKRGILRVLEYGPERIRLRYDRSG